MDRWALGLDLGQASDFSALAGVRERDATPEERAAQLREYDAVTGGKGDAPPPPESHHEVPRLHRWPLGTPYPTIVAGTLNLLAGMCRRRPGDTIALVVDYTGVGRPVFDLFAEPIRALPVELVAVTITSGNAASFDTRDDGHADWHVPKRGLVSAVQIMLQGRRLHIAKDLPEAATLQEELQNFRMKITASANAQYEAWRDGQHDDLVLAEALASWALLHGPLGQPFHAAAGGKRIVPELR
mgnify:CR=1 FL=1